jgi:hypothetical protein
MDMVSLLATVVLAASIATLLLALAAYAAYKIREARKPEELADDRGLAGKEPVFLAPKITAPVLQQLKDAVNGGVGRSAAE